MYIVEILVYGKVKIFIPKPLKIIISIKWEYADMLIYILK